MGVHRKATSSGATLLLLEHESSGSCRKRCGTTFVRDMTERWNLLSFQLQQVPVSAPVSVAGGYAALPVCSGPHHVPICTAAAHMPMCTTQPTWSLPGACNFAGIPACGIQHLPSCGLAQVRFNVCKIYPSRIVGEAGSTIGWGKKVFVYGHAPLALRCTGNKQDCQFCVSVSCGCNASDCSRVHLAPASRDGAAGAPAHSRAPPHTSIPQPAAASAAVPAAPSTFTRECTVRASSQSETKRCPVPKDRVGQQPSLVDKTLGRCW